MFKKISAEPKSLEEYTNLSFNELNKINNYGGFPRLYQILEEMFINENDDDKELTKVFTRPLLDHFTSRTSSEVAMNLKQCDNGQIIFYGFPNGNYIR